MCISGNVPESRRRRWEQLNPVLENNKKANFNQRSDGSKSTEYSDVNWEQVKKFFPVRVGSIESEKTSLTTMITDSSLDALVNYLKCISICFHSVTEGREVKRIHFIAPIIMMVCSVFNDSVEILCEEDVVSDRVHAHGHFEFVLRRGSKRLCIVEAKKDDILQGKVQVLMGCESICDADNLSIAYGVATNYLEWCFLKNSADEIVEEMLTLGLASNQPTVESVRVIANKICSILS